MKQTFTDIAPSRAFHGSMSKMPFAGGLKPACLNYGWQFVDWQFVDWRAHDRWMDGGPHLESGIPYPNIIWEACGLRDRNTRRTRPAPWARSIRTHRELGERYGFFFVTDTIRDAARYGSVYEIDLDQDGIVDVIEDPHVRTHNGWIVVAAAGSIIAAEERCR